MQARRLPILERWEALLRIERANTPLANPDLLVHLFDGTLSEIFAALRSSDKPAGSPAHPAAVRTADCPCGRNPLIAYFAAGEQALLEGLVMAQVEGCTLDPVQRDLAVADLLRALRTIAHREISAFCAVCQYHPATLASVRS